MPHPTPPRKELVKEWRPIGPPVQQTAFLTSPRVTSAPSSSPRRAPVPPPTPLRGKDGRPSTGPLSRPLPAPLGELGSPRSSRSKSPREFGLSAVEEVAVLKADVLRLHSLLEQMQQNSDLPSPRTPGSTSESASRGLVNLLAEMGNSDPEDPNLTNQRCFLSQTLLYLMAQVTQSLAATGKEECTRKHPIPQLPPSAQTPRGEFDGAKGEKPEQPVTSYVLSSCEKSLPWPPVPYSRNLGAALSHISPGSGEPLPPPNVPPAPTLISSPRTPRTPSPGGGTPPPDDRPSTPLTQHPSIAPLASFTEFFQHLATEPLVPLEAGTVWKAQTEKKMAKDLLRSERELSEFWRGRMETMRRRFEAELMGEEVPNRTPSPERDERYRQFKTTSTEEEKQRSGTPDISKMGSSAAARTLAVKVRKLESEIRGREKEMAQNTADATAAKAEAERLVQQTKQLESIIYQLRRNQWECMGRAFEGVDASYLAENYGVEVPAPVEIESWESLRLNTPSADSPNKKGSTSVSFLVPQKPAEGRRSSKPAHKDAQIGELEETVKKLASDKEGALAGLEAQNQLIRSLIEALRQREGQESEELQGVKREVVEAKEEREALRAMLLAQKGEREVQKRQHMEALREIEEEKKKVVDELIRAREEQEVDRIRVTKLPLVTRKGDCLPVSFQSKEMAMGRHLQVLQSELKEEYLEKTASETVRAASLAELSERLAEVEKSDQLKGERLAAAEAELDELKRVRESELKSAEATQAKVKQELLRWKESERVAREECLRLRIVEKKRMGNTPHTEWVG